MSWRDQKEYMYQNNYQVPYFHCAIDGTLVPGSLFRYWTDTSIRQTDLISDDYCQKNGLMWVLYAWTVEIGALPTIHQDVKTSTFARDFDRFYGYRNFILESSDGELLAKADSIWLVLDVNKMRPVSLIPEVISPYGTHEPAFVTPKPNLREEKAYDHSIQITARKSEIDFNEHVNNAAIVDWFFEALDWKFVLEHRLSRIQIVYKKQTYFGEDVEVAYLEKGVSEEDTSKKEAERVFSFVVRTDAETKVLAELTFLRK